MYPHSPHHHLFVKRSQKFLLVEINHLLRYRIILRKHFLLVNQLQVTSTLCMEFDKEDRSRDKIK